METTSPTEDNYADVLDHIKKYWQRLIRDPQPESDYNTLLSVPNKYLIPTERSMFSEMYYWDTYFISIGLMGGPHEDLVIGMAENLADLFRKYGIIPNANRGYFLSRSQPPLFTKLVWLAYKVKQHKGQDDSHSFLKRMIGVAEQEHETVWLGECQPHDRLVKEFGLSRYFDTNYLDDLAGCESGWDHSPRCGGRWLHHLPIDLNAILYAREMDFSKAHAEFKNPWHANLWEKRAEERKQQMNKFMWDDSQKFFFDYDYEANKIDPIPSLAGFFPLWAKCATPEQATLIKDIWLPKFEYEGGLATTTENDVDGEKIEQIHRKSDTLFQWVYPNGWAPLQWIVVTGLENYGFRSEAQRIRKKWCDLCAKVFRDTANLWEKYNVVEVEQPAAHGGYDKDSRHGQPGFGWTNGVFVEFARFLNPIEGYSGSW